MGIARNSLLGLCYAAANGIEFKNTLTIGRMHFLVRKCDAMKMLGITGGGGAG
jgi:hypothetical protein